MATPEKLEKDINYNFTNNDLLIEALSHPSLKQHIPKNGIQKNYERLELLGDAIINFAITEILFKNHSTYDEGKLAKIRSYLVSKDLLCKIAAKINLSDYIIMTSGEEILGGRKNLNNIENTMEALIAAVYLDSNIDNTKQIIYNLWQEFLSITDLADYDPKSTLQELVQKHGMGKPIYEMIKKEGPAHSPIFTITVKIGDNIQEAATGHTVKEGEKNAARKLINILNLK
ncbi:MAG: ribonuclease III [Rickettsia endosymbiont of Bryobia graminum]|nr:ribonuclease III [Rickettsia endosymbiont of Bryobia graminum]